MFIAGVTMVLGGALVLWVMESAARGTLKRNEWAGFRFGSFMFSEEAWRAGHTAGRAYMRGGCVLFAASGIFALAFPTGEPVKAWITLGGTAVLLIAVAAASIVGSRAASASAREGN